MYDKKILLNPSWARCADTDFAQGVQVGNNINVSGQVAQAPDGQLVGDGDMAAQARQIFSNIEVILALANASLSDLVSITTYVIDMSQYAEYAKIRKSLFPLADIASATVVSPELVRPGFLIEIEARAVIGCGM